jgi:hypothetical protein
MAISLASISRRNALRAPRLFVYSVEGIGKTTFAAGAPAPIFIQTEDGLGSLDVPHFPLAAHIDDVTDAIGALYTEQHEYQTVVLDSVDWADALLWQDIEAKHEAKDLAYGKGAMLAADRWRQILDGLNALRNDKGMTVILLGHCQIKRFDSPETEPYDRYMPKLQDRSSALIREWVDAVLFANYRTVVKKTDVGFNKEIARGITTGERLIYTAETPAYMAKNRYSLPASLPLSFDALAGAITSSQPAALAAAA